MYWISLLIVIADLACGQTTFSLQNFNGQFAAGTGVLQSLKPASAASFDFAPSDFFSLRNESNQHHTGDLTFRYRASNSSKWLDQDTSSKRVTSTGATSHGNHTWISSLNSALPGSSSVLNITRTWSQLNGDLTLQFSVQNIASQDVELGSLGIPIELNNIFTTRAATEVTQKCVLIDPYIGLQAGYVQATRLTGNGPNLVITPLNNITKFEAWRFLPEPSLAPLYYQSQTYEGNYEWQVFTKAWAEQEWSSVSPWNPPTSAVINPGQTLTFGLRFSVAPSVDTIEETANAKGIPVAVGIPGYVLQQDLVGQLFINTTKTVKAISSDDASAFTIKSTGPKGNTWQSYTLTPSPNAFGRQRVTITYTDGMTQAVHYYIVKSGPTTLDDLGSFLTTKQWYTNTSDPFHRAPSVISYDHSANDYVLQDPRSWIAGLSDEGGAGSFLAAGMKQSVSPSAAEIAKLESFTNEVVWGELQSNGSQNWTVYGFSGNTTYAVRKSLFFYQPSLEPGYDYGNQFPWAYDPGWAQADSYRIDRAYDYVHVSALYWGLYRSGRTNPGTLTQQTPQWYLLQAYNTVIFAGASTGGDGSANTGYYELGLMGETVWGEILNDLRAENYSTQADTFEAAMKARQQAWAGQEDPFGSEMAWDSTGQEGVYYWSQRFGDHATAQKAVQSIRGYMPTVAHWGWNGNARRYWDFQYGGSYDLARVERQIHHYGSGLNALPLLANYRNQSDPESLANIYDLRVGYGGNQGPLTNVQEDGFGSMAFHSYPDTLQWDSYSGDYGPNFSGHVLGAASYLVNHPVFGWISFGGNIQKQSDTTITVQPRDTVRRRVFVAELGVYATFDNGLISSYTYNPGTKQLDINIGPGPITTNKTQQAVLRFDRSPSASAVKLLNSTLTPARGGYLVNLPATLSFK